MKIKSLDGRTHTLNPSEYVVSPLDERPRSSLHLAARQVLREIYPLDTICEEVSLPDRLFLDFFLPLRRLVIEVNGSQHFKFSGHFHKNRMSFLEAKQRDVRKREFCSINSLRLVDFNYDETPEAWKAKLLGVQNG